MIDKRQWKRIDVDLSAQCSCSLFPAEKFDLKVLNINSSGMCCCVPMMMKPGQKLTLSLDLKALGKTNLTAKVVWSGYFENVGEYRAGLKIAEAAAGDEERYQQYYHLQLIRHPKVF